MIRDFIGVRVQFEIIAIADTVMVVASVTATARLKKDYARLLKEPVPFVRAAPLQENILEWHYIIYGAPNTPYDGRYPRDICLFAP